MYFTSFTLKAQKQKQKQKNYLYVYINTMEKKLFNLILENILYENIWNNGKVKLYIGQNDVIIEKKENIINFYINGLGTSRKYEKENYSDFIINLSEGLYTIISLYIIECEKENYSDTQIMEMWQE